jgi:hypothetical protein
VPDRFAGAQDRADQVGRGDIAQQVGRDIFDPAARAGDAGIVDQRVEPAEITSLLTQSIGEGRDKQMRAEEGS